jgi:hypothetical protein
MCVMAMGTHLGPPLIGSAALVGAAAQGAGPRVVVAGSVRAENAAAIIAGVCAAAKVEQNGCWLDR